MTDVDLQNFAIYLGNGVVYFVLGLVLLFLQVPQGFESIPYKRIRRFLAYSAFVNLATDVAILFMQYINADYLLLNHLFTPLMYYIQLNLIFRSLFKMIHSPEPIANTKRSVVALILPVAAITLTYIICFCINDADFPSFIKRYEAFTQTIVANTLRLSALTVIAIECLYSVYKLASECQRYQKQIDNYFTGQEEANGVRFIHAAYVIMAYLLFSITIFVFCKSENVCLVLTIIEAFIFIAVCIGVMNIENTYHQLDSAFHQHYIAEETTLPQIASAMETSEQSNKPERQQEKSYIEDIIQEWIARENKPYLKEGITLTKTAESMHVSARALSDFINSVYHVNFNTWLNTLRIEEIKRIIENDKNVTMMDLAFMAGFTDQSAMSKVFKRIVGETPSAYRNRFHGIERS